MAVISIFAGAYGEIAFPWLLRHSDSDHQLKKDRLQVLEHARY